jgi:hypothetical protein
MFACRMDEDGAFQFMMKRKITTLLTACSLGFPIGQVALAAPAPDAEAVLKGLGDVRAGVVAGQIEAKNAWAAFARAHPVAADWAAQDLGARAGELLADEKSADALAMLADVAGVGRGDEAAVWKGYLTNRTARRAARLNAVIEKWGPWVFTEAHTFQMSFIGYTEGLSDARAERFFKPGTRLMTLDFPKGSSFGSPKVLLDDPHGMMRDVDVSFDLKRVMFAWKKSDRLDDYHIYEHDLENGSTRQITRGLGRADYEPIYLPNGEIIFASTRPEQSVPCWWTEISNLYRADKDGNGLRRLAIDQVHTLYPQLMSDGRITYTRWDYNDRGQNYPHPLFSMIPDGRDQRAFYGANSWFPNSLLHARGIPGSHQVVAVAAGHHTKQQGKLVIIDNTQGRDEGVGMRFIVPNREVPYERVDVAMQKGDLFRYPYPLGEGGFVVSLQPEHGVPGFGLYWVNEKGERELLHVSQDLGVGRMVPTGYRPPVAELPEEVDFKAKTAFYHVHDVYQGSGLAGIERGEAKWIRVVRLNYRAAGVGKTHNKGEDGGSINSAPIAIANASWDVKEILGDVEIHADGSALFEVPAMESIYLQVLDAQGRVIQTTRSWDTLRPGETKGCVGCHDKSNGNVHPYHDETTMAWKHGPQKLRHPFEDGHPGFSFHRIIQPILDSKCISCHDGTGERMDLRGIPNRSEGMNQRAWTTSYLNLTGAQRDERNGNWVGNPDEGLVRWIHKQSRPTELPPYYSGAARSPLMEMLEQGHEGVVLDQLEMFKLAAWIDLLVPFSGDYREGGMWSTKDHAHYTYYETKRGRHHEEEQQSLVDWLDGIKREREVGPLDANYRMVSVSPKITPAESGAMRIDMDHPPVMTDRIRLMASAGEKLTIRGTVKNEVLAEVTATGGEMDVTLKNPTRSDRIHIKSSARSMEILGLHGVTLPEIPTVDGHHPFLGDEIRESK